MATALPEFFRMNPIRLLLARALFVALSPLSLTALARGHDVLVCSYFTAAGSGSAAPTVERPSFCSIVADPARSWHGPPGDEPPPPEAVRRLVRRGLGVNSYHTEDPENRAHVIVVYHWGWISPLLSDPKTGNEAFFNRSEMIGIVAGRAFDRLTSTDRTEVMAAIREERFFVIVSAYDAGDWAKHQRRTLLWRTHLSVPSERLTSRNAAPILLAAGGSLFGRDTLGLRTITIDVAGALRTDPDAGL